MSERFEYLFDHPLSEHVKIDGNSITFTIQDGPIGEKGINGCQIDDLVDVSARIIRKLNKEFPCRENSITIGKLEEALMWLNKRKEDREKRGVEGLNKD